MISSTPQELFPVFFCMILNFTVLLCVFLHSSNRIERFGNCILSKRTAVSIHFTKTAASIHFTKDLCFDPVYFTFFDKNRFVTFALESVLRYSLYRSI